MKNFILAALASFSGVAIVNEIMPGQPAPVVAAPLAVPAAPAAAPAAIFCTCDQAKAAATEVRVEQLERIVSNQADQIVALKVRLAELERPKAAPVAMKPVASQPVYYYSSGSCSSGSCGNGFARRGIFGGRRR